MARNEQLIRQHKILQILERYRFGRTLEEVRDDLVDDLGLTSLHTRTVRRDLEALQAAGIHIVDEETQRGRVWKLGPTARTVHKISASATELIALSLGRDLMNPLAGTPFWQGIETFWNKIRDELPSTVWEHYEKYRRILYVLGVPAKSYDKHQGTLKTINRAILEHRVVEVEYQSIGKPTTTRLIEPYAVVFYQSSLYIIAAAHEIPEDRPRIRHLKLDRFQKATALDQWFKPPVDFRLEEHLGKSVGIFAGGDVVNVKIRVSAYAAPWVLEDPWHPDQQVERLDDGSIHLTVPASHELEVAPRVLALGSEAEVLEPASCRQAIAETVRQLATMYGNS
ncbi:MAG: WYL domain-containing protein [Planctomycetales bacterium]|nr:WYL domain-containing protein [Planctomycetales bacterium]